MDASGSLPPETWQTILRYAILVPDFLDPGSFEGTLDTQGPGRYENARFDEAPYWETEQTRNNLKRVCRSWNAYLSRFDHRYVRIIDLWHGKFEDTALKMAIRISFLRCNRKCGQESCARPADGSRRDFKAFSRFCGEAVFAFSFLPAEILDTRGGPTETIWNSGALRSLAKAQVIIVWSLDSDGIDVPLFCQTPSLKHLHGRVDDDLNYLRFTSRTLVTLSFRASTRGKHETLVWDLPALRHLRVGNNSILPSPKYISAMLLPLLRSVGRQLYSLHIETEYVSDSSVPLEIWDLCPQIERLHAGRRIPSNPPASHPIKTVSIPLPHLSDQYFLWLQWPSLKRVIVDDQWSMMDPDVRKILLEVWTPEVKERGIRWEDMGGVLLEDSITSTVGAH